MRMQYPVTAVCTFPRKGDLRPRPVELRAPLDQFFDARRAFPYPPYDGVDFEVPVRRAGDVDARVWIRIEEAAQSARIILVLTYGAALVSAVALHGSGRAFQRDGAVLALGAAFGGAAGNLVGVWTENPTLALHRPLRASGGCATPIRHR